MGSNHKLKVLHASLLTIHVVALSLSFSNNYNFKKKITYAKLRYGMVWDDEEKICMFHKIKIVFIRKSDNNYPMNNCSI